MKLNDLNPRFLGAGGEGVFRDDKPAPRREGVGVEFDCPCGKCGIPCYVQFDNPLDGGSKYNPPHAGWKRTGETFETLTLTPSILRTLPHGCGWHGFITNGEVITV